MTFHQIITRIISSLLQKTNNQMTNIIPLYGSPEQLQIILNSIDAFVYVSDMSSYELLFVNEYGRKIFGNITGTICWQALQADQSGPCPFCTNDTLIGKDGFPSETRVWEFQNTITGRWYECRDSAIQWTDGRLVRLEIATDITGRKITEDQITKISALREDLISRVPLEEKLDNIAQGVGRIFDTVFSGIWLKRDADICTEGCRFFHSNDYLTVCKEYGCCLHLVACSGTHSGNIPDNFRIPLGYHNIGKIGASEELKIVRNDISVDPGEGITSEIENRNCSTFAGYRLISPEGNTIGVLALFRTRPVTMEEDLLLEDLATSTSHVILNGLAEKSLQEKTDHYRILVENIPQKIYMKDINFEYLSCNKNFAFDLNISTDEIIGKTDYDLFPGKFADMYREDDKRLIETGKTEELVERYLIGDRDRWINSVRTPLKDTGGNVTGILGIFWDITERVRADEELKSLYLDLEARVDQRTSELAQTQEAFRIANEKLNLLNSITRHDILNQITALGGYLQLSQDIVTDSEALDYIRSAEISAGVIHRHILFTRLYQDIGVHSPSWQQIQVTVKKAVMDLSKQAITFDDDLEEIEVYADPLLEKVFYTLIENTLRHGEHATSVQFSHQKTAEGMVLTYGDNGAGISRDDKERIFERGYGKNTGFGLYLAREILAITNMTIQETGIPGSGARFEIFIPKEHYRYPSVSEL